MEDFREYMENETRENEVDTAAEYAQDEDSKFDWQNARDHSN